MFFVKDVLPIDGSSTILFTDDELMEKEKETYQKMGLYEGFLIREGSKSKQYSAIFDVLTSNY